MKGLLTLASLVAVTACASATFAVGKAAALSNECQLVSPKICVSSAIDRYGCLHVTYTDQTTGRIIWAYTEC